MTDLDLRLRDLTAELAAGPKPPAFDELRVFRTAARTTRTRRGPQLAAAAAALVVLVIASIAVVRLAGGGRSVPTPATEDVTTPGHNDDTQPEPWSLSAMEDFCRIEPLAILSPGGQPTMQWTDMATHEIIEVDARDHCLAKIPLTPDPAGDMGASFGYADGRLVATYYEKTTTNDDNGTHHLYGAVIPPEEAAERLAAQKQHQPQ